MKSQILSALLVLLCCAVNAQTTTLYVDIAAPSGGDGHTWGTALKKLSDALDTAWKNPNIAEIHVAKGTYTPAKKPYAMASNKTGTEIITTDDKDKTFHIRTGLELFGGYPTGGGARNTTTNVTRLRGKAGTELVYHTVLINCPTQWGSTTDVTRLDGFTVDSGKAIGTGSISVNSKSIARNMGGGLAIYSGTYALESNKIAGNTATGNGGGIYAYAAKGKITNSFIEDNKSTSSNGGGYYSNNCNTFMLGDKFDGNEAYTEGGAMYLTIGQDTVKKSIITNNKAKNGAGIATNDAYVIIYNNTVATNAVNATTGEGAGIKITDGRVYVIGNLIDGNSAGTYGGGGISISSISDDLNDQNELVLLLNNTISNNTSKTSTDGYKGGGVRIFASDVYLVNNIFWRNKYGSSYTILGSDWFDASRVPLTCHYYGTGHFAKNAMQLSSHNSYSNAGYNLMHQLYNNYFNVNPDFTNQNSVKGSDGIYGTTDDGLQLSSTSLLIDKGFNDPYTINFPAGYPIPKWFTKDMSSGYRVIDTIDIGAYEQGNPVEAKITGVSKTALCQGDSLYVTYTCNGILPGNVFTLQLSNSTGTSWGSAENIGTVTASTSGTLAAYIPANISTGTGYRLRLIASAPAVAFDDNGQNISINAAPDAPYAKILQTSTVYICDGTPGTLNAWPSSSYTYQWMRDGVNITGATNNTITSTVGGAYKVTITSAQGCSRISAGPRSISVKALPANTFATAALTNGNKKLTATAASGTYQWYNTQGVIAGATARTYTVTITDDYYVTVEKNGCSATGTPQTVVAGTARMSSEVVENGVMSIQPNPSSGAATISIPASDNQVGYQISVFDMTGRQVEKMEVAAGMQASFGAALPVGMYTVVAISSGEKIVAKWLKQ